MHLHPPCPSSPALGITHRERFPDSYQPYLSVRALLEGPGQDHANLAPRRATHLLLFSHGSGRGCHLAGSPLAQGRAAVCGGDGELKFWFIMLLFLLACLIL